MSSSKRLNGFLIPSRPGSKTPLKRAHVTRKQADRAQHTHSQGRSTTGRIVVSKREVRLGSDSCERKPLRIEMLLDQRGVIRNYRKRKKRKIQHITNKQLALFEQHRVVAYPKALPLNTRRGLSQTNNRSPDPAQSVRSRPLSSDSVKRDSHLLQWDGRKVVQVDPPRQERGLSPCRHKLPIQIRSNRQFYRWCRVEWSEDGRTHVSQSRSMGQL